MSARLAIDHVLPAVEEEPYAAKGCVGELFPISTVVWGDGHDTLGASVVAITSELPAAITIHMTPGKEPDSFHALLPLSHQGLWQFRIEAWRHPYATWRHHIQAFLTTEAAYKKDSACFHNELSLGVNILTRAQEKVPAHESRVLQNAIEQLSSHASLFECSKRALSDETLRILELHPVRELLTRGRTHRILAERQRASQGAWYEFFPRSTGGWNEDGSPAHGTFRTSLGQLERAASMGFDVVYLPPIHPIGTTARKGRNNTLVAHEGDVGSPWAIGDTQGGHEALHADLGTEEDFEHFLHTAESLGLEVALDFALQCSPDHPWVAEHPEWFTTRPDGTIACAENPPKKYQDIYPLNFDNDPEGIRRAVLSVALKWIKLGVRIFRVDNPHTKPPDFWSWLIGRIWQTHPEVIFLSEAFTRPARQYGLAKLGFSQSYTYFTWREEKKELIDFMTDLISHADVCRPNFFVNTPDILTAQLAEGGAATFALRAALAATLSPSWGVYSGFELFEHHPLSPGSEEYLDSEKYELRPRDFSNALRTGQSLEPWITQLNTIRRSHPALLQLRTIRFHYPEDDAVLAFSKHDPLTGDLVLVVINLDPYQSHTTTLWLDLEAIGQEPGARFPVREEVTGLEWEWGEANYIRLDPLTAVAHIISLPRLSEKSRHALSYRS